MTRKDYVLIADAIKRTAELYNGKNPLLNLARELADQLQQDNPRFDRQQFLAACGVEG